MRTVLLASLHRYARRYVAAVLAVTITVGFVVVTNALTSAAKNGISAGIEGALSIGDLAVGDDYGLSEESVTAALDIAAEHGDEASVVAMSWHQVTVGDHRLGEETPVGTVADSPALLRQEIASGRAPTAPNEALVSENTAAKEGVSVGDTLLIGSGDVEVEVVGLTPSLGFAGASVYVPWSTFQTLGDPFAYYATVLYDVGGAEVETRAEQLRAATDVEVRSIDDFTAAQVVAANQGVDILGSLLLLFAVIAAFVSVLVIGNTFTILFAQRSRDLALLRCVGATRRQVLRAVRRESSALAVVASLIGVLGGMAAGYGLVALIGAFSGANEHATVEWSPIWLIVAFLGGVTTTLVAAWWPTRQVTRLTPLDALRPAVDPGVGRTAGRVRLALGGLLVALSAASFAVAVTASEMSALLAGGVLSFLGVLALGPILVPALLRGAGRTLAFTGPSARIAATNAVRNPRRSATTASSLLVGVTLAVTVLTGMASGRQAINGEMDLQHPVDVALTGAIPDDLAAAVADTDGVAEVASVPGVRVEIAGLGEVAVLAPDVLATADPGELLIPAPLAYSSDEEAPDEVTLTSGGRSATLRVEVVVSEWGDAAVVAPSTLAQLADAPTTQALWVSATDDADGEQLDTDLGALARTHDLDVENGLASRAWVDLQLDIVVWTVLGLLGVGVAIALVGIANTVGLSVLERAREHALLRALGLTRRQLRRVLAMEGLLLALVATLLGVALGVLYGWLGTVAIIREVVPTAPVSIPWASLAAVIAAAVVAGLLACVLPARRAARIAPAEGLTLD
ncbi:MAG: FtsX-like permease family protein [Aeromicrobium sp.]|uniref:ABC transporter permease n=1 Tax=Aeromicrobium sp. TaxID=1871063 RepID=UPI0039E56E88